MIISGKAQFRGLGIAPVAEGRKDVLVLSAVQSIPIGNYRVNLGAYLPSSVIPVEYWPGVFRGKFAPFVSELLIP